MVNPAGKAPSKTRAKRAGYAAKNLVEYGPALRKMHSGFDKLSRREQVNLARKKYLQEAFPDDPDYSNKAIRNQLLSYLGVASGKYDDSTTVKKDSDGRERSLYDQKFDNPAGFAHGGAVHKGRKAMRGAD